MGIFLGSVVGMDGPLFDGTSFDEVCGDCGAEGMGGCTLGTENKQKIPHPLKRDSAPTHSIGMQKAQMTAKRKGGERVRD